MELIFDKKRDYVYEVSMVDFPYTYHEIISELKQEEWTPECPDLYGKHRAFNVQSEKLKNFANWISSDEISLKILDTLDQNKLYFDEWRCTPAELLSITHAGATWTLDKPGFETSIHLDNRFIIGNGMMYFIEGDDPDQSTVFYTDSQGSNPLRIPTGFARGWFAANTNDAWHKGYNLTKDKDRYSLYWNITLNVQRR